MPDIKTISNRNLIPRRKLNSKYILYVSLFMLSFTCVSCLKERGNGDCPVTYRITLGVKDKNYANIGNVPELSVKDEQLPFKAYVSTLMYYLRNMETGMIIKNVPTYAVTNNDKLQELDLTGISAGRYILSVFGNDGGVAVDNNGMLSYALHSAGTEGLDTYLLSDTLDLNPDHPDAYAELQRTKGMLYILLENLPDSVARIECQVTGIYQSIDQNGGYSDEAVVRKMFTENLLPSANILLNLAPTVVGKASVVRLALYARNSNTPFMFIPDFDVNVKRNEVAAFRLDFKSEGGVEIWIAMDGTWTKLHDMDITII